MSTDQTNNQRAAEKAMEAGNQGNSMLPRALLLISVLFGLVLSYFHHYILFHSLAEGFCVIIASGVFMLAWNSRTYIRNNYLLFLGIAFLYIGFLDFVHALSYKGMGVFQEYGPGLSSQLWIATRYMHSITLLIAPLFLVYRVNVRLWLSAYTGVTALIMLSIFVFGIFPVCFVEGVGLTPFKIVSEYIISLIFLASLGALYLKRERFDRRMTRILGASIILSIISEVAFTQYLGLYDAITVIAHLLKIVAYYLVYVAIIETGLTKPYNLLFRDVQHSEERFRTLAEATFEGVAISEQGRMADVNDQFVRISGYRHDELIGMEIAKLVHPEDRERVLANIIPGRESVVEHRVIRKDGQTIVVEAHGKTISERGLTRRITAIRDITERKRMEEALRESEERYRGYFQLGVIGMAITSPEKGWIDFNEKICEILGYEGSELKSFTWEELTHPDDREMDVSQFNKLLAGEIDSYSMDKRFVRKDSRIVHTSISVKAVRGADGSVEHVLCLMQDITERKRMEEELRRSRDELELRVKERTEELRRQAELLELATEAIIVRDLDDRIVYWNKGAEETYGWTKAEAMGNVTWTFLHTRFPESLDKYMSVLREEGHWEGELIHTGKDGRQITVLSRHALQRDETGKQARILELNVDVTGERRLEEAFHQSQKMEAIGTLAGGIAHDFNNMLAVILGNAELALDDTEAATDEAYGVRHNIEQIIKASKRSRDLVKQILLFSKKSDRQRKVLGLNAIVKETVSFLRGSIPNTIDVRFETSADADTILGDPSQIQQVIMNLASNAVYAMGDGGTLAIALANISFKERELTPEEDLEPGSYVKLTVRDTGTGMSREISARIFEPFFTTKKHGEGTGMGLAVVFGIVKSHGGAITLDSKEGEGSTFAIFFPVYEEKKPKKYTARRPRFPQGQREFSWWMMNL